VETLDVGHLVLVGVGAVAAGLLSCLDKFDLRGRIDLIDPDYIDETNLNRYVSIDYADVRRPKAEVWANILSRHPGLDVRPFVATYGDYRRDDRTPKPLVVVSTDNRESRQQVQRDLPKLVINAATDGARVTVSTHRFGQNACLGCLYPIDEAGERARFHRAVAVATGISADEVERLFREYAPIERRHVERLVERLQAPPESFVEALGHPFAAYWARELCGRVELRNQEDAPEGTAPFVSALAGALAAGEVVKARIVGSRPLNNYFLMNVFVGPTRHSLQRMKRSANCAAACYDPTLRRRYRRLWRPPS
jgi:molybdopterin/thiamine biosynthesis adenylyltransferase